MTSSPLRGDALIGAVYRLALHSRKHRSYSLATFTDKILRAVSDNRFRIILNRKTMDIKAIAVWEDSAAPGERATTGRKTARPYVCEFIALDSRSAHALAKDLRATLFDGGPVRGVPAFVHAADERHNSINSTPTTDAVGTA